MTRIVRVIAEEEAATFRVINHEAFGHREKRSAPSGLVGDEDRRFGVFDDGELVGVGRNFTMQLTMPGATRVPVGGVSWVGVHPIHRRRGVMTALISALVAESTSRGEVASILTASEGSIYWGQGYGPATWGMAGDIDLSRRPILHGPAAGGRLRSVVVDEHRWIDVVRPIFARAVAHRPGMVTRPDFWWLPSFEEIADGDDYAGCVVHTDDNGVDDGYALFTATGDWSRDLVPEKVMYVADLIATTPDAHRALWQHLLERDLVKTIKVGRIAIDDPIRLMFTDTRAFHTRAIVDRLWIRPIDAVALLSARSYSGVGSSSPGAVVIEVEPSQTVGGKPVRIRLSSDGVEVTQAEPDLSMSGAALGAISLGGTDVHALVTAGRVRELHAGAAKTADALLFCSPKPAMLTSF
jgi:predicted acetyltransferase